MRFSSKYVFISTQKDIIDVVIEFKGIMETLLSQIDPLNPCDPMVGNGVILQTCNLSEVMSQLNRTQFTTAFLTAMSFSAIAPLMELNLKLFTLDLYVILERGKNRNVKLHTFTFTYSFSYEGENYNVLQRNG